MSFCSASFLHENSFRFFKARDYLAVTVLRDRVLSFCPKKGTVHRDSVVDLNYVIYYNTFKDFRCKLFTDVKDVMNRRI